MSLDIIYENYDTVTFMVSWEIIDLIVVTLKRFIATET